MDLHKFSQIWVILCTDGEGDLVVAPKLCHNFLYKNPVDSTGILLTCFQFQNLIYHFPEQITNRASRLCSNLFIFAELYFIVILPRRAICKISFSYVQDLILRFITRSSATAMIVHDGNDVDFSVDDVDSALTLAFNSRSLKVIRCSANRRGIYDFLLALTSNLTYLQPFLT